MNRTTCCWAAVLMAGVVGCVQSTAQNSKGRPQEAEPLMDLVAQARPPIADLPIPIGFSLEESKSRSFEAGGLRYIDHVYQGRSDKFAVKRFFERHMPISRWTLVTDMFIRGDITMDFEKESERCRILVSPSGVLSAIQLKITVWTSGPIRSPAERKTK